MMGATLMTVPEAAVAEVARHVGFRSSPAFARALADAGFPPPSEIRQVIRELGDLPLATGPSGA